MALKFQSLTRTALKDLATGKRIAEHGITAERTKTGDVRYSINIMVDGQRIHRVIGKESEGVTREQAERAIETFRTKAREERLDLPNARKRHLLFKEAAADYLDRLTQTLASGKKGFADLPNKRRNVEQYLVPYFGNHQLHKITNFAVKHYARQRHDQGAKQATINRELATLSHLLNKAVSWKWIKPDQKPEIEKGEEDAKQIVILSINDQKALMQAAIGDQDPATWLFVAFGLNTAMRHSEILRVRWDQIDFKHRRINIPEAKAGQRQQPITKGLAEILEKERGQRDDQKGYIFAPTRIDGKSGHRRNMSKQFARTVSRAKLDTTKVTPHIMRHTAITQLVQSGVDLPTIKSISGHKTLSVLMRYVHLVSDHIDQAVAHLDTGIFNTISQELHTASIHVEKRAA